MSTKTETPEVKFNAKRTLLLGVVFLSISILNGAHDNSTNVILTTQFGMKEGLSGLIMAIDNILALFMLPIFGRLSDGCNSKWGKRKPFVFFGTIAACVFLMLFPLALRNNNLGLYIMFICLFLVSLGTYRSAGVALVSDVTIKPLRSKANAIINLMGTVAGLLTLLLTKFLYKDADPTTGIRAIPIFYYYLGHIVIAIIALVIYVTKINEVKLSEEREKLENDLQLEDDIVVDGVKIKLDKAHMTSLILILISIFLWTFGFNAITTKFGVYGKAVLNFADGNYAMPMIIAQVSAFACFVPIGAVASKIGRRKTILSGLAIAIVAFAIAIFSTAQWLMYVVFVLAGIASATIVVNTLPMVTEFANKNTIGQFTGYYYIATQTASALTPFIVGMLMDKLGYHVLFPYSAIFAVLAFVPLLFVKYGDSKPIPAKSKLEAYAGDD